MKDDSIKMIDYNEKESAEKIYKLLSCSIPKYKELYIWGTGNTATLYQEGLKRLEPEGVIINGYIDNDQEKWGNLFFGKKVYCPEEVKNKKDLLILISAPQPEVIISIGKQIDDMKCAWMHIDKFILSIHKAEVLNALEILDDDYSKALYIELIEARIEGRYPRSKFVSDKQYFAVPEFSYYNPTEVFVDCGAFVGDSIERYIYERGGAFEKIIAFEPDKKNLSAMEYRIDRLQKEWGIKQGKIELYPYGVGAESSQSFIERSNNGLSSRVVSNSEGASNCKIVSLDDFFEKNNSHIDFIKADIESFEYKLVLGAEKIIKKHSPKLALCIYHNSVDFYQLIAVIENINPKYKISLRHHTHTLTETVLYARL